MSYDVKLSEVDELYVWVNAYTTTMKVQLDLVCGAIDKLVGLEGFQGAAANGVKAYFQEMHGIVVEAICVTLSELEVRYAEYANPYFTSIDSSLSACFAHDPIAQAANYFGSLRPEINQRHQELEDALSKVSDLVDIWVPSLVPMDDALWNTAERARSIDAWVSDHESYHAGQAQLISSLTATARTFLSSCGASATGGVGYVAGSALSDPSFADLAWARMASDAYISHGGRSAYLQEALDNLGQRIYERWEREEIKRRHDEGEWQRNAGYFELVIGGAVCVCTAGAATLPVAVMIAGTWTAASMFSVAEIHEGDEKLRLADAGDVHTPVNNFLRDSVFGGDQVAYDNAKLIVGTTESLAAPASLAASAWKTGGIAALKQAAPSLVKDMAKDAAADMVAKAGGAACAKVVFDDEPAGKYFEDALASLGGLSGLKIPRNSKVPAGEMIEDGPDLADIPNHDSIDLSVGAPQKVASNQMQANELEQ